MINFTEDRTNTHQKGTKELKEVVMRYTDGTEKVVTEVEPTMVLVGYNEFKELLDVYKFVQDVLEDKQ